MTPEKLDIIAKRPAYCSPFGEQVHISCSERDYLVTAARRYQWLREQPDDCSTPRIDVVSWTESDNVNEGEGLRLEKMDNAIDAAMAGESS